MKAKMALFRFSLLFVSLLLFSSPCIAAWWDDTHADCPCFTSSLIDAQFSGGILGSIYGNTTVVGNLNDINGEVAVITPPRVSRLRTRWRRS